MSFSKATFGALSWNTTVLSSGAVTVNLAASVYQKLLVAGSWRRLKWATTASALNGVPSENVMPWFRVSVQVLASLEWVTADARYGPTLSWGLKPSRAS